MNGKTHGDYRVQHGSRPGDDGLTAGVAGQGAGQPEAAGQVRRSLYGPVPGGRRLIRGGQLDSLPAQPGLRGQHLHTEELAGRRRRPRPRRGPDLRPGAEPRQQPDHVPGVGRPDGSGAALHSISASRVTGPMLAGLGPVVLAGEGGHGLPSPGELAGAALAGVRAGL
jgi:hypothetical protein